MGMYRQSNWDVPNPGTGGGTADHMTLRCTVCAWAVSSESAVQAVGLAQRHSTATGHDISYRGVVQQRQGAA